jgi:hypothetical protein
MADIEDVRGRVADIARRRKNVELAEIQWVANHLKADGYAVSIRRNDHSVIFQIGSTVFSVCTHNRGSKQLKPGYVGDFLEAMEDLGLYES